MRPCALKPRANVVQSNLIEPRHVGCCPDDDFVPEWRVLRPYNEAAFRAGKNERSRVASWPSKLLPIHECPEAAPPIHSAYAVFVFYQGQMMSGDLPWC